MISRPLLSTRGWLKRTCSSPSHSGARSPPCSGIQRFWHIFTYGPPGLRIFGWQKILQSRYVAKTPKIRWFKLCLHMYSLHLIQMCSTWCCTSLFDGHFQTFSIHHLGVSPRYPSPPASMAGTMEPLVSGWFLPSWNVGERLASWPRCGWNDGPHYSGWYQKIGCPQCVGMRQIATPPVCLNSWLVNSQN